MSAVTPVDSGDSTKSSDGRALAFAVRGLRRVAKSLFAMAVTLFVALAIWQLFLDVTHLNPYFAKSPRAVYDFLFTGDGAASARETVWSNLEVTLRDAGLGYAFGTLGAILVSFAVVMRRSIEQTVMPIAIALRAVPLVAMTPLIVLILGRGLVAVTFIAGVVTFFPSLVNIVAGLRSVPANALDLMHAYGASDRATVRLVQLPYALPALFAAAKIAAPGSIVGATLAEWLATGKGLGALMLVSSSDSDWSTLWSCVVVITATSILIYNVVSAIEGPVVQRYRGVTG